MSRCGNCGRERDDAAQFCGTCGMEFGDSSADAGNQAQGDATRTDTPAGPSGTFASWYQPPGGPRATTGEQYQPTQTAIPAAPPQASGYSAQTQPGYQAPPPAGYGPAPQGPQPGGYGPAPGGYGPATGAPPGGPEHGGARGLFIALAVIVVLAAGGGAYALATSLGKHATAQPPTQTSTSASPTAQSATSPSVPASGSATSQNPPPSPTLSQVSIAPGVTSSATPAVETLLSHYFHAINTRNYAEYASTLNAVQRATQPRSSFESGYATTQDTGMTLTSLTNGVNGLTATVTFTSRQSPAKSADNSACNNWTLSFYLVPQGNGYLIGPPPNGYKPTYSDC